jgi:hypothetical protein
MKVDTDTVQALRERIAPLDTDETRQAYREGRFPRSDAVNDLDMRYRWDLYWAARGNDVIKPDAGNITASRGITKDHIDTALRRIVAPLGGAA